MSLAAQSTSPSRSAARLDPLAFPQATVDRFLLFAILLLLASWYLGTFILANFSGPEDLPSKLAAGLASTGAVLALAAVLYLLHPALIIWRDRLTPLTAADAAFAARVQELWARMGLRPVRFLVASNVHRQGGQAFGFPWRPCVRLDRGLVLVLRKDPQLFDTVVTHELAHVANGDLLSTYTARALFWAFLTAASIVCLVELSGTIANFVEHWWPWLQAGGSWLVAAQSHLLALLSVTPFFPVLLLVALEYARLLRLREHFADWRTAAVMGDTGLQRVLARTAARPSRTQRVPLTVALGFHPSREERQVALDHPGPVLTLNAPDLFLLGIQLSFLLQAMTDLHADLGINASPLLTAAGGIEYGSGMGVLVAWGYAVSGLALHMSLVQVVGTAGSGTLTGGLALVSGLTLASLIWPSSAVYWLDLFIEPFAGEKLQVLLFSISIAAALPMALLLLRWLAWLILRRWRQPRPPWLCLLLARLLFVYAMLQFFTMPLIIWEGPDFALEFMEEVAGPAPEDVAPSMAMLILLGFTIAWVVLVQLAGVLLLLLLTRSSRGPMAAVPWPLRAASLRAASLMVSSGR